MSELPPATLEGWYALHQMLTIDWTALAALDGEERAALVDEARRLAPGPGTPVDGEEGEEGGWSGAFQLIGGGADLMLIHFRDSLEALAGVELAVRRSRLGSVVDTAYDYVSVTEAGLYHATAQAAEEAEPGSKEYHRLLAEMAEAERASPHLQTRLYPRVPEGMRYVSFYPMNKRREHPDNWYQLTVAERNRLMREHGMSGRRYAGKIFQVITGSVGFDDWEWGVTLFARDPLEFKNIVTEMRYDEASARFGEFGAFFVGFEIAEDAWPALLDGG